MRSEGAGRPVWRQDPTRRQGYSGRHDMLSGVKKTALLCGRLVRLCSLRRAGGGLSVLVFVDREELDGVGDDVAVGVVVSDGDGGAAVEGAGAKIEEEGSGTVGTLHTAGPTPHNPRRNIPGRDVRITAQGEV